MFKTSIHSSQPQVALSVSSPIGVFDSGVGGLSIFLHLQKILPDEQYLYFADTLHVPYGGRSPEQIAQLTMQAVDWLCERGCKLVVIACNSASAYGLKLARQKHPDIPIVGLVPALKPAVKATKTKKVAVLATAATLEGSLLNDVIDTVAEPNNIQVIKWFDPQLVPWVEKGMASDSPTALALKQKLHEFDAQGIDNIVLGCTHYPFFTEFVQQEINKNKLNIRVMDSGAAIAARVHNLLQNKELLRSSNISNSLCNGVTPQLQDWQTHPQLTQGVLYFYATQYSEQLGLMVKRLIKNA